MAFGAALALFGASRTADAACTSNAPASGQTVTCTGTDNAGVLASGSTGVTVNVSSGATVSTVGTAVDLGAGANVQVAAGGLVTGSTDAVSMRGGSGSITVAGSVDGLGVAQPGITPRGAGSGFSIVVPAGGLLQGSGGGIGGGLTSAPLDVTIAGQLRGTGFGQAARLGDGNDTFRLISTASVIGAVRASIGTDTLLLGGATDGSFDVSTIGGGLQYAEFELFGKEGTSTWTLTGAGNQAWTITNGTLDIRGSAGAITVGAAGRLMGTGQLAGITAGGIVAPGASIGTLSVNGPVTFQAGSTYAVEVDASGASDRIVATGAASLLGGTVSVLPAAGAYPGTTDYTILSAAGGVTGTFASLSMDAAFAFLQPSLLYSGNAVMLRILNLQASGAASFASVAETGNQRAVARTLDALGDEAPFYGQLLVQTPAGARDAYDALGGELNASLPTAVLAPTSLLTGWLHDRLSGVVTSPGGGPLLLAAAPLAIVPDGGSNSRFESGGGTVEPTLPGVSSAPAADAAEAPYAVWARAFGDLTHVAGDGNAAAVDSSGGGFFLGGDLPVAGWLRLGAATGYSHQNASVGARSSSADLDGAHAALYGTAAFGPLRLRAVGTFAYQAIDTRRRVQIGTVSVHPTASYGSTVAGGLGEVGWAFDLSGLEIQPYAGIDYVSLHTDSFTEENGGAANLRVDSATDDWPTSVLGIRLVRDVAYAGHVFRPRLDAAWGHTFGTLSPDRAAAFASSPALPFTVSGAPLARDAARIGAGLDLLLAENLRVGLEYRGDLAPDAQDNGFGLALGWRF